MGPPTSHLYLRIFLSLLSFHPKFSLSSSHFLSALCALSSLCALSASLGFLLKHEMGWLGLADLGVVGLGLRFVPLGFRFCRLGVLGFAGWVFWVLPLGFQCTAWWWLTAWAWAWVHRVVVGFSGFCWLGFLCFAAWVLVHDVVVVDGLGLGLGSRRGGWKRVWIFGGGAVGLGLEVVEPCRIWVFFYF